LAGRTPFGEGTVAQKLLWHQTRQPKPVTEYRKDVPAELASVIARMMAKEPDQRYQTPAEVADALEPFTGEAIAPPPDTEMPTLSLAALGLLPPDQAAPDTAVTPKSEPTMPRALQGMGSPAPGPRPTSSSGSKSGSKSGEEALAFTPPGQK